MIASDSLASCLVILLLTFVTRTLSQMPAMDLASQAAQSGRVVPSVWTNGKYYAGGLGLPIIYNGNNRPSVGIGGTVSGGFGGGSKPNYGVGVGINIPFG